MRVAAAHRQLDGRSADPIKTPSLREGKPSQPFPPIPCAAPSKYRSIPSLSSSRFGRRKTFQLMAKTFTFAHLSDIHLAGYKEGAIFDLEADVRRELVYDLERVVGQSGPLQAILIGGDVAGAGQKAEYDKASKWIDDLCEKFSVPLDNVFCVPGNHDVNWARIRADSVLGTLQIALRDCSLEDFGPQLEAVLTNGRHCGLLLEGLSDYNEFAFQYGCAMALEQQRWEHSMPFGELTLQIIGLASPLISGPLDSRLASESKLALGPQGRLGRFRNTVTIMMCHHPPAWLRDRSVIGTFLERAHLQLYGHEHSFSMERADAGFRIDAGALHPARDEPWQPSYNVLSLHESADNGGEVVVDLYARGLNEEHQFGPLDSNEEMRRESMSLMGEEPGGLPPEPLSDPPQADPINERELARRFVSLSVDERLGIGKELGLLSTADEQLPEGARMRRIFETAREKDELAGLQERLDA
jgi:calcineurin-like phosphoesterase family protein/GTPase-associated adaptor domain-containing protein